MADPRVTVLRVPTPRGPARAHVRTPGRPAGVLVLGHGAGGSVDAPDLCAAADAALEAGCAAVAIEQPYRVAGRRSPAPAAHLDAAWIAVLEHLAAKAFPDVPLVTGGRSSGARVACRTAAATGAVAVVCLAFPLHPPGRPAKSRLPELEGVDVPVLVMQGERDPFGMPPPGPAREVLAVPGDHSLRAALDEVRGAIAARLPEYLSRGGTTSRCS